MHPDRSDITATWIVALSLVGAIAIFSFLPDLPPRWGTVVAGTVAGPRADEATAAPAVPVGLAPRRNAQNAVPLRSSPSLPLPRC